MPSGHRKKRASFFGWSTLKGNPSQTKENRAPLGNRVQAQQEAAILPATRLGARHPSPRFVSELPMASSQCNLVVYPNLPPSRSWSCSNATFQPFFPGIRHFLENLRKPRGTAGFRKERWLERMGSQPLDMLNSFWTWGEDALQWHHSLHQINEARSQSNRRNPNSDRPPKMSDAYLWPVGAIPERHLPTLYKGSLSCIFKKGISNAIL